MGVRKAAAEAIAVFAICITLTLLFVGLSVPWRASAAAEYTIAVAELVRNLIPNLMAAAIVFLAVYWYLAKVEGFSARGRIEVHHSPKMEAEAVGDIGQRAPFDIRGLIATLENAEVIRFRIIAISGGVTVKSFLTALARSKLAERNIEIRVLLRSPFSTDKKRAGSYLEIQEELKRFESLHPNIETELRSYACTSPLHCVIAEHNGGKFSGYLGFYDWTNLTWREGASNYCLLQYGVSTAMEPLRIYLSWFDHFWGARKVHTLIFDFDDTLFLTTDAQVHAWIAALNWALQSRIIKLEQLTEDVRVALRKKDAFSLLTKIFLDEQDEESIFKRLFDGDIGAESRRMISEVRFSRREELTENNARPIAGVIHDIQELRNDYQLIIVSATSENLIQKILKKHRLDGVFSFVLGKDVEARRWQDIENKAQHFIRVSSMLGVPLERMIFVGDSDADYRSARRLGIHYIENRFNAAQHGRETLIKTLDSKAAHFISGAAEPGELKAQVGKIEAEIDG